MTTALAATCLLGIGFSDARADDARRTATIGNPNGPLIASICGHDAVAVGLRVATERRGYVASVASLCEDSSGAISVAPAIEASPGWPSANSWCALTDVANGIHGRAGDIVDAIGIGCRDLDDGTTVGGWGGARDGPLDCRPGMVLRGVEGTVADYFGRAVVHSVTGVCGGSVGTSAAAKRCQQNGWQELAGSDGTIFASTDGCVSHVAEGGTLVDRAPLLQCQQHLVDAGLTAPPEVSYLVGTPGDDDLGRVSPGIDVVCGFAGHDRVGSLAGGDVFLGGAGIDIVGRMSSGTFIGGPGVNIVDTMSGGRFDGGADTDLVGDMSGGTFDGGDGNDTVDSLFGTGIYNGGAGFDTVNFMFRGTFNGGDGNDRVWEMYGGTFNGGPGDDRVGEKFGGTCTDVLNC